MLCQLSADANQDCASREQPIYRTALDVLCAPDPTLDHEVGGSSVLFTTSGEGIHILDFETQHFCPTTLTDGSFKLCIVLETTHSGRIPISYSAAT